MNISRREFLQMLAVASASGFDLTACGKNLTYKKNPVGVTAKKTPDDPYELPPFGNVSFLHYTDCHAQLLPIYFREPNINLGVGPAFGRPPHLVGNNLLKKFGIPAGSAEAHAFTHLNFEDAARKFGKMGGFAHLATLVKKIRAQRPGSLLLDGGDTWGGGSGTGVWTNAQDMVDAQKLLGIDIMTGHWEFTFGADRVREIVEKDFKGRIDFLAQNIVDNQFEEDVFKSYVIKEMNGVPVGIIGQAFPYTTIANPRYLIPDWSFSIREHKMQQTVDEARGKGAQAIILLSHNGIDVDLKMASRVTGIDAILGGHTHDAVPAPIEVTNKSGKTLVINSGSNGKFLAVLDLDVKKGKVRDYRLKMLPVFSNLLDPDSEMKEYIDKMRNQQVTYKGQTFNMKNRLEQELAITDELLYRRGNFIGTFDQLICDALIVEQDAEIAFSPGFRWGVSILPGQPITFEHVMTHTGLTYPTVSRNEMTGDRIKVILEDVADNLFNKDPYYQQGGDMVRVGGMSFSIDPNEKIGKRIQDMELNGSRIQPRKKYVVAGWAGVAEPLEGTPVWDILAKYLKNEKTIRIKKLNMPKIIGMRGNPGMEL